jgi:outer membrane lipoprotein-sorting protein
MTRIWNDALKRCTSVFFALLICLSVGDAQTVLTPEEMLKQFEQTFANVRDFTATIEADIDMERLRIPKMNATVYFKRPDRMRYSAPGFALLPREGMSLNPVALREKYVATLKGLDTANGCKTARLDLMPRDVKAKLKNLTLWLDTKTWTPVRMETAPYGGRQVRADFTYEMIDGKYLLPATVLVQFEFSPPEIVSGDPGQPHGNESSRNTPRSGRMTVRYKEYKINSGLSD